MENTAVSALKKLLSLVPKKAVRFTYLKLFKPKPLRKIADSLIKAITPAKILLAEGIVNLNRADPAVSGALALGAHDPFEIECFRDSIEPGMNVVDIGANIGYYTVIAAGRVGPGGASSLTSRRKPTSRCCRRTSASTASPGLPRSRSACPTRLVRALYSWPRNIPASIHSRTTAEPVAASK